MVYGLEDFVVLGAIPVATVSGDPHIALCGLELLAHSIAVATLESRYAANCIHDCVHDRTDRTFNSLRIDDKAWLLVTNLTLRYRVGLIAFHKQLVDWLSLVALGNKLLVLLTVNFAFRW